MPPARGGTVGAGGEAGNAGAGGDETDPDQCSPTAPPGAGPLLRYDFESQNGSTISDSSESGNHGTLSGGRWVSAARHGAGIEFYAADQYIALPERLIDGLDRLTVSAWLNLAANPAGSTLFDFGADAANHLFLATNTGTGISFGLVLKGQEQRAFSSRALPLGVWQHVAAVIDRGRLILYVDGLEQARADVTFSASALSGQLKNWVGRSQDGSGNLSGALDDFRVYGRALDSREIQDLAAPEYRYFPFDEGCGNQVHDISPGALKGDLPKGGTWTTGRVGGALELDGKQQYVMLPAGVVESCDELTLAFWAQRTRNTGVSEHILDFGQNQRTFLYVTPESRGTRVARFAIKLNGDEDDVTAEQALNGSEALSVGLWQHLAVTLRGGVGTLYVDGVQYDSRPIALKASALGKTMMNTIGRSQYFNVSLGPDSFYAGRIDELRIACRAFSADEVGLISMLR